MQITTYHPDVFSLTTEDMTLTEIAKAIDTFLAVSPSWKPVRNLVYVRELPVEQTGLIVSPIDLNRSTDNTTFLQGIVEAVGPKCVDLQVGDRVWFAIHAGEFRIPGDDMVRIMYEGQIEGVERPDCPCPMQYDPANCTDCGGRP